VCLKVGFVHAALRVLHGDGFRNDKTWNTITRQPSSGFDTDCLYYHVTPLSNISPTSKNLYWSFCYYLTYCFIRQKASWTAHIAMDTRAQQTAAVISIFAILGALFVFLRLWTRFFVIRASGWEDWVLLSSWVSLRM
jgi:hypothetical protein